jgi:short subunit dehydrogenase-like uncharacterized protein
MTQRIVLWGATGYTGQLVAQSLAGLDLADVPVALAGRDEVRLHRLRDSLSEDRGWEVAVADSARPESLRGLISGDDVVVATVGPFSRVGWPAATVAADSGAAYLDSSGEAPFIRRVHDTLAVRATLTKAVLAPAFGYDYVPGQIAAAYAMRDAPDASGLRVGYFTGAAGEASRWMSGGTQASVAAVVAEPSYAWRHGGLVTERPAARVASLEVGGRPLIGMSVGAAEHLFLPVTFPGLRDIGVYLGWAGGRSRLVQAGSTAFAPLAKVPGSRRLVGELTRRFVRGSTGGPSADQRSAVTTLVVAEALNDARQVVSRAEVSGPNPYDLTASLLALAALRLALDRTGAPTGVVGPLQLFGVDGMLALAGQAGLRRTA